MIREETQPGVHWLDSLGVAVLILDDERCPQFLSTLAAELLEISNRSNIAEFSSILAPLTLLANLIPDEHVHAGIQNGRQIADDITLTTARGRPLRVFAQAGRFLSPENGRTVYSISFLDVDNIDPLLGGVILTKRVRSLYIPICCAIGQNVALDDTNLTEKLRTKLETNDSASNQGSDILPILTTAINIADALIPSTVSIQIDTHSTALVAVTKEHLLRILCHLFLSASDFLGTGGKIRVKSALVRNETDALNRKIQPFLHLLITAQQNVTLRSPKDLFSLYLARRFQTSQYNITLAREGEALYSLSPDTFSEDLKAAAALANKCRAELSVHRPDPRLLAFSLHLPLVQQKMPG